MKIILKLLVIFLPWKLKRLCLNYFWKYQIHPKAHIGFSFIYPKKLIMEEGAQIGHLNVAIHLSLIHISLWIAWIRIVFEGKLNQSFVLDKLVYNNKNFHLPIYYENMFSSNANFNLFLTYSLPSVKFKNPVISTIHDLIVLKTRCESKQFIKAHERDLNFTVRNSSLRCV